MTEPDISKWDEKFAHLRDVYAGIGRQVCYAKEPPATEQEVAALEDELGQPLPPSLRRVLTGFAKRFAFAATLPDSLELPNGLGGIFGSEITISPEGILEAERNRVEWTTECFTEREDEYDRVWYDKLGFMDVPNGDVIAFDLADPSADRRVVYLSHDDGSGHGRTLGDNFADYIDRLIAVGGCGPEDWQMLPFMPDEEDGIRPDCKNAVRFRTILGLSWEGVECGGLC